MKLKNWFRLLFFFGLMLGWVNANAHPYHVSIAEVKYNTKTQNLEIALKLISDDLEKTLSELAGKPVVINQTPEVKKQLEAYLKNNFRLEFTLNQIAPQRFIGLEQQDDAHWFYLDIPVKASQLSTAKLRNQVLVETFPDQNNLTNLEINGKKRTLIFKEGEVVKPLL